MSADLQQLLAVSVLIGQCEVIAESGLLGENDERDLRWTIAKTLAAFNMPTRAERCNDNHSEAHQAGIEALVCREMKESANV